MFVTIALLIKNGEDYLSSLLESLKGQESEATVCILGIDSGATDYSFEILRRESVRVIEIPSGQFNHGETRNLAAQEAVPNPSKLDFSSRAPSRRMKTGCGT